MGPRWAVLVAACVAVAGCSGNDYKAKTLPTLTPSPSASASASHPATAISALTPAGAAAFARHWFDVLNRAAATGETKELRALGAPDCRACKAFADSIDAIWKSGRIEGGVFSVVFAEAPGLAKPTVARVSVQYNVTATKHLDAAGHVTKSVPPLKAINGEMTLVRSNDSWLLRELVANS